MTFADRLKQLMLERRPPLTQQALAERIGVTQAAVSDWARHGRIPQPSTLNKLCLALGVRRDWLLYGEGDKQLPDMSVISEMPAGYARREKLSYIEDRFPEALPMLDAFLESLQKKLPETASTSGTAQEKKGRPISYREERRRRKSHDSQSTL